MNTATQTNTTNGSKSCNSMKGEQPLKAQIMQTKQAAASELLELRRSRFHRGTGQKVADKRGRWVAWLGVAPGNKRCRAAGESLEEYLKIETSKRTTLVFFIGRSAKPAHYYSYVSRAKALQALTTFARNVNEHDALKETRKAKSNEPHVYKPDDVLVSVWGYEQTNVDYYQVTAVVGAKTLEVRKIEHERFYTGDMNGKCMPLPNQFVGEIMRRRVDQNGLVNVLGASYGRASKLEYTEIDGVKLYRSYGFSEWA